jgi:hypothetical protein
LPENFDTNHLQIERVTGIDRKTIRTYAKRIEELKANSSGVATGTPEAHTRSNSPTPATGSGQVNDLHLQAPPRVYLTLPWNGDTSCYLIIKW